MATNNLYDKADYWFFKGVNAARAEKNSSGCGCELDDGDNVVSMCLAHRVAFNKELKQVEKERDELRETLSRNQHALKNYQGCIEAYREREKEAEKALRQLYDVIENGPDTHKVLMKARSVIVKLQLQTKSS